MLPDGDKPVFDKSILRRYGVAALHTLFVVYVLAASVLSLVNAKCHERTLALTLDGIWVGLIAALIQLLVLAARSKRICSAFSLACVARLLVGHHVRFGTAGGYTYGVSLAAVECVLGW